MAVVLTAAIGGMFAHRQFGLTLTGEGIVLASPLGRPPELVDGTGSFAYLLTQDTSDEPVAYDPCEPIPYVVNDALAPAGSTAELTSAVAEVSAATGLHFESLGSTSDLPRRDTSLVPPRKQPVLIAWTTPDVVADLDGRVAGVGGSTPQRDEYSGRLHYITGTIALDAPQLTELMTRQNGPALVRAIIMHELGHLLGLDHVDDQGELMYEDNVGRLDLGPGDRQGLAALGSGRCFH
jgi:hypothetical protein